MTRLQQVLLRTWRCVYIGLLFGLLPGQNAWAAESPPDTVWLLSNPENTDHHAVVTSFMQQLAAAPASRIKVRVIDAQTDAATLPFKAGTDQPALIVAIGSAAARLAQAVPRTQPVLDILIPRLLYEQLTPADSARSALYIDQPFERQLKLCRLIMPDLRHVAVLFGPSSQASERDLRKASERSGISLIAQHVTAGTNPNAALDQVLDDSQLLLALPDPDVFTRYTVAGLLLTAYHHAVPIVGFSAAYVKAGALAAVFSTPEQIGREAAEMVLAARNQTGWSLPTPRYPTYYDVAVNRQVGRSLNLNLPDDDDLRRALARQESAQR